MSNHINSFGGKKKGIRPPEANGNFMYHHTRLEVFVVVTMKITVCCDLMQFSLIDRYNQFGETCCLKMGTEVCSDLVVPLY
jgi:hypothetical protein